MVKIVKLKTEHVAQMRTLFEVLKEILADTTIEFIRQHETDEDKTSDKSKKSRKNKKDNECTRNIPFSGMRILTVSPEKTVLICLKLHAHKFIEFVCKPKIYEIGVNLVTLNRMLKSTDKEDELEMYVDNDDKQSLVLSVNNSEIRRSTEFKLKLMDIDPTNIQLPPVEPDVMITMDASEFHKLCKDMAQIGQFLEIKCTNNTLIFTCDGNNSSRETKYTANEEGVKIVFVNPNKQLIIQGVYELKHLNLFSKCASLSNDIQILMKVHKYPLCITYTVATLGDFIACISPIESQAKSTYEETEALYQSDDEIVLKKDFDDNDSDTEDVKE
jgi:proliferating cell nuclear antigen